MTKTLYYVLQATVPDHKTIAQTQRVIAWLLDRAPVTKHSKTRVFRPRGELGALLRKLEK